MSNGIYATAKRRILAACLAVAALVAPVAPMRVQAAVDVAAAEAQFLDLLNADRTAAGMPVLQSDSQLMDIARWRSEDMVARNFFSHDLGGFSIGRVLRDRQIPFARAGENLVSNTFDERSTVARAQAELMKSASHRENILNPDFDLVGVGIASSNGRTVFTQIFVQSS